eukprot:m.53842 g.53842  ORF g.53842 m.53842 type:complete len:60 (+) comp34282_c0_seq17:739-918(+)
MLKSNVYRCPTCCKAVIDMTHVWERLDDEIAQTPMPEEYKDTKMKVLCKDCNKVDMRRV